ncbi:MAG TPA: hypothetical protein VIU82_03900 [Bosea sp. (in: a-proteobacteria)]
MKVSLLSVSRHCERSEAIQETWSAVALDCFAALAMTGSALRFARE